MTVLVNGKSQELEGGETVAHLLERLGLDGPYALVERNGEPVERTDYGSTRLAAGDQLVVARPVAGG
jgi:sulfur carrier protein